MRELYFIPTYIQERQTEQGIIIWNSANDAEIELEECDLPEYRRLKESGTSQIKSQMECLLSEEEFLINSSIQKELYNCCLRKMHRTLYLVIMPTEACNFRCIYCYEKHEGKTMSPKVIKGIKKYFKDIVSSHMFEDIQISWFGGEPTLCTNIIVDIMDFVKKEADPATNIHSTITTNGYNLDVNTFLDLLN